MAERFLPTEDPVMESVLQWTVERDAKDVRRLLEWLRLWPFGHTWQSLFMLSWRQGNGRSVLGCYCRDYLRRTSWESLMCNWG